MKDIHPDYRYTENHEWATKDGPYFKIGMTDFGQTCFKEIQMADLPEIGTHFNKGECLCTLESSKAANEVEMPLTGIVVAINELLLDQPNLVNEDYYGKGWLVKIEASDTSEWQQLFSAAEYKEEIGVFFRKI